MREAYIPSRDIVVDESMIPFQGRSSLKQLMPMKPVKRGIKVWCLAYSSNGFVANFEVYTDTEKMFQRMLRQHWELGL